MTDRGRRVVSRRDWLRLLAGYGLGRLSAGAVAFALLLTGRQLGGGLGVGALAVAGYTGAVALAGPLVARRADVHGPRAVLGVLSAAYAVGLGVTAAVAGTGSWALILAATATGAVMPPLGPTLRATLTEMFPHRPDRTRMLTAESMLMEVICLVGPLVVSACALVSPRLALLVVAVTTAVGGTAVARTPFLRVATTRPTARPTRSVLRPKVTLLVVTVLLVTGALSALEVGIISFAGQHATMQSGLLLAALAAGSLLGGLAVTLRPLPGQVHWQLPVLLAVLAAGTAALTATHQVVVFAVVLTASSLVVAPAVSTAMTALGDVADESRLAETFGWAASANYVGVAGWTAAGGGLAEAGGPGAVFWFVAASAAGGVVLTVVIALRSRSRPRATADAAPAVDISPPSEQPAVPSGPVVPELASR